MFVAREGYREIAWAAVLCAALGTLGAWLYLPLAIPFALLFLWVLYFFRDPKRRGCFEPGQLCAPADGTITEITELERHEAIEGPAVRIGMFLSLFNVHINRMPCSGAIRSLAYRAGEFLDARHPQSGRRNESNAMLIEPDPPLRGPVEVRQIAGLVARRIICHAKAGQHLPIGARFGLIKFGSRTELIFPHTPDTRILVAVGDKVRAGLTVLVEQPIAAPEEGDLQQDQVTADTTEETIPAAIPGTETAGVDGSQPVRVDPL